MYYSGIKTTTIYEIAKSYTANSWRKIIFRTKYKFIFNIVYFFVKMYYKNKMFIWKGSVEE